MATMGPPGRESGVAVRTDAAARSGIIERRYRRKLAAVHGCV
jgi:hypothetical protein